MPNTYTYSFTTALGRVSPLAGFMFIQGWSTANNRVPSINGSRYLVLSISGDSEQDVQLTTDRFTQLGVGHLRNESTLGTAGFSNLVYCGGSYGEHANERGPGVMVFRFNELNLAGDGSEEFPAWTENLSEAWAKLEGVCRDTKTNLNHRFNTGANQPISPVYSPRVFDNGNGLDGAAVTRPFLNSEIYNLITATVGPVNWVVESKDGPLVGRDITPRASSFGGFHLVTQGSFKKLGWWHYPRLSKMFVQTNATNAMDEVIALAYELVGPSGPLPRNLENCDKHNRSNVVAPEDPSVEVLYVKL